MLQTFKNKWLLNCYFLTLCNQRSGPLRTYVAILPAIKKLYFFLKPNNVFFFSYLPIGSGQSCSKIPSWIKNALNSKIINGQDAVSPIPWQVRLIVTFNSLGQSFLCGGTILDEETILSAAHCFIKPGKIIQYLLVYHACTIISWRLVCFFPFSLRFIF